ncbi:hypothetical protein OIU76_012226 [Salix suchowensis]|nr:hypothetical protein OIU76_012226 [Salix suchowensis]
MVHVFECIYYNNLSEKEQTAARSCGGSCHRKLPNCTHLCPKICHPGQCPSPDKCTKKVTVRCQCQTLKKEMPCQEVQAAYHKAGSNPKDVSKSHFGLGLLPCNSGCKSKAQVVDQELHLRKSKDLEEKVPATEIHIPKRRKRRERLQETKKSLATAENCCHHEVASCNCHPCGGSDGSCIFRLQRSHVALRLDE